VTNRHGNSTTLIRQTAGLLSRPSGEAALAPPGRT